MDKPIIVWIFYISNINPGPCKIKMAYLRNVIVFSSVIAPTRTKMETSQLTNLNFTRISTSQVIEEETIPGYNAGRYYPTRIGEILKDRYQVVGKLGFGASSTT